ncbi:MAG TPA: Uma2 family endonuclease [Pyrinomonadaceae bacterium]|nr:Uma2 family endonuclease [Pyrinomonadaceae bacterium]
MTSYTATLPRRKFSVKEYHDFIKQGVFKPEERIELWEGEFIEMSPIGKRHASLVDFLVEWLISVSQRQYIVRSQNPIILDDFSEPQPDVCILRRREDFYRQTDVKAADVLLTIEVADSTVKFDRDIKFPRYAANGIEEAWLIDLENERIEIHTQPTKNGYRLVKILHRGDIAESTVFAEIKIAVDDILG